MTKMYLKKEVGEKHKGGKKHEVKEPKKHEVKEHNVKNTNFFKKLLKK